MADAPLPTVGPDGLNLMSTYGPILIGAIFSCIVWGISCMQLFLYFMQYGSDHIGLKSFVMFIWLVDAANEILLLQSMFPTLILKWGSLQELSTSQPALIHHGWVAGIVSVGVQMFFILRIYQFSGKKWWYPWLLTPVSLFQIFATIPADIWLFQTAKVATVSMTRSIAMEIALRACTAFTDIVITVFMVSLLVKYRDLEFKRTRTMYYRLVIMSVNTGFWTAIVAIIDFSLVAAFPKGLQFLAMEFPLSSLYVNALLANLNARRFIRKEDVDFIPYQTDPNLQKNLVFRDHDGSSVAQNRTDEAQDDAVKILEPGDSIELSNLPSSV